MRICGNFKLSLTKASFILNHLGFGLNYIPKIMSAVLCKVFSMDPIIKAMTDCYIDDTIVNTDSIHTNSLNARFQIFYDEDFKKLLLYTEVR